MAQSKAQGEQDGIESIRSVDSGSNPVRSFPLLVSGQNSQGETGVIENEKSNLIECRSGNSGLAIPSIHGLASPANIGSGEVKNDIEPIQNSGADNHRLEHCDNSGSSISSDVQPGLTNESKTETEAQDGAISGAVNRGNVANADAELRPGGGLGVVGGEDALSATLVKLGSVPNFDAGCHVATSDLPHVATDTATRGESPVTVTKQTVATRGKSRPVVEAGKGSKGTWQLRLRWNSEAGRPVYYVATVADSTYELIRKGDYEAYKRSLIAEYEASAVSADNTD